MLTRQGPVDDHSLSNKTHWRRSVSCSIALSSTLRGQGIGRALRKTGGDGKRVSVVEGSPEPPKVSYADQWRNGQQAMTENQRVEWIVRWRVLETGGTRECFRRKRQKNG